MKAIDLGPVEAAASKTPGGKIRLRLLLTADQLEAMLIAARTADADDVTHGDASADNVTHGDASADNVTHGDAPERDSDERIDDEDDAPARDPVPPTAPVGRKPPVFVIEGTRAWDAWLAHELRTNGRKWTLTVRREVDGRTRSGWHFPSLFPPT